jgi:Flp pilus assembly protein TadG
MLRKRVSQQEILPGLFRAQLQKLEVWENFGFHDHPSRKDRAMRLGKRKLRLTRRGKVLVMTALLLPALMGGMAVSIDYGVIAAAQAELRTAADGAALAGAMQLADENRVRGVSNLSPEISAAQAAATSTAQSNKVLNTAPVIVANGGNASGGDIVVGYLDPNNVNASISSSASTLLYNAVSVTTSRNSSHTGVIPTFFGGAIGLSGTPVQVTSVAIAQPFSIQGFQSVNGQSAGVLPIVLDSTTYNDMINANNRTGPPTTDQYSYDPSSGKVTPGSDGVYESVLYPVETGSPGNWGTVKIGVSQNSTSTLDAQITGGITPAELAAFPGGVFQLDPQTGTLSLGGNPGISAGIQSAINSVIGRTFSIPIYTDVSANGNNAVYTVNAFGAVRLMASNFSGNPKYVIVQPAILNDPTIIAGSAQSGWGGGGVLRIYLAR